MLVMELIDSVGGDIGPSRPGLALQHGAERACQHEASLVRIKPIDHRPPTVHQSPPGLEGLGGGRSYATVPSSTASAPCGRGLALRSPVSCAVTARLTRCPAARCAQSICQRARSCGVKLVTSGSSTVMLVPRPQGSTAQTPSASFASLTERCQAARAAGHSYSRETSDTVFTAPGAVPRRTAAPPAARKARFKRVTVCAGAPSTEDATPRGAPSPHSRNPKCRSPSSTPRA